ncbi:DUF2397 family protein [Arthrobacter sp. 35W]|uniref:DUF2397 family protein n=1 Tax=Arthrobacter sp. 35W TaxID=1132441 RepID=UPI0003FA7DB5|nr:DUF2397 family protein [Arthrobacter sp. 35W]
MSDVPNPSVVPATVGAPVTSGDSDSRAAVGYLIRPEADEYIAVMTVLEASVTEMSATEVRAELARVGRRVSPETVEARLDALIGMGAVSYQTNAAQVRRVADLLARNWRYTPTLIGRQVQRFYREFLTGTPTVREIPISALNLLVTNVENLAAELSMEAGHSAATGPHVDAVTTIFTSHDSLDSALVGAEDELKTLANRFDLDDESASDLKGILVGYATRVATELTTGSSRAAAALDALRDHYDSLAAASVSSPEARQLIAAGALRASRGGRVEDWVKLREWCDPATGRAERFTRGLIRALPTMHANLQRLHTSSGTATNRTRALSLARAVLDPTVGAQVFQAAVGDHSWRKLYGTADEDDAGRNPSWRGGPVVAVPELLRTRGRSGPRGRGTTPRNDRATKAEVEALRRRRQARHDAAVREVLAWAPGTGLSEPAARVALESLMAAARASVKKGRRTATAGGLGCTLVRVNTGVGVLRAPIWQIVVPGRVPLFHLRGQRPSPAQMTAVSPVPDTDTIAYVHVTALSSAPAASEGAETVTPPRVREGDA